MGSQRLNRFLWKPARNRTSPPERGRLSGTLPLRDHQTGFIHHPAGFPLEFKRIWFGAWRTPEDVECQDIGLLFECDQYIPPGATLEISIPLRSDAERFRGQVVLVRHNGVCYEIGLWLPYRQDAGRMRIVEQICHIEAYLKQKKFADGPYALNREQVAEEWINRFAGSVPPL